MSRPITDQQAVKAIKWLKSNYGDKMEAAVEGTPFTVNHLAGIVCQETAYFWLPFLTKLEPDEILARCVLDGSGDVKGAPRSAFPRNTEELRASYGKKLTDSLISEGNKTRVIRGLSPWTKVYKGYGLFQYDLQFIKDDRGFWDKKLWYSFDEVLKRVMKELNVKYARQGTVGEAIRAYNGSGRAARQYRDNVLHYARLAESVN